MDSAGNAIIAWQKIEENEPHLVVLDVNMPCGNGLSVCETMADHPRLRGVPVIILTGDKDQNIQRRCYGLSAYYVPKCQNVWPRIKPLLHQLLPLAPLSPDAPAAASVAAAESPLSQRPLAEPQVEIAAQPPRHCRSGASPLAVRHGEDNVAPPGTDTLPQVLCIDDDYEFSRGLKLRLARRGVDLLPALDGMEGYRCASQTAHAPLFWTTKCPTAMAPTFCGG